MKYFGTDGIRGKAFEFITEEMSFRVGKAMHLFKDKTNKIIIARDTRISGAVIVENIKKGALMAGLDVCDIGVYATPILAFAAIDNDCFGIMVTASHNPYYDNGIKIFNRGKKTVENDELLIEEVIDNDLDLSGVIPGREIEIESILKNYYQLYENFTVKQALKVGLDLANGATIKSAMAILPQIFAEYHVIGNEPDGYNINKDCGSTHLDKLQDLVRTKNLDLGIAFDGDGDRILVVDDTGMVIDGDLLIYIFAKYLKDQNILNNNVVVLSKMSNLGIIKALTNLGIRVVQTDVGDKYIFRALDEEASVLGGENSGHIINKTVLKTGDGVLNAWYLLKILNHYQTKLSVLKQEVSFYPDVLINIKNIDRSLVDDPEVIDLVDRYRKTLGEDGKVLVRKSGTEPLIRVSVSAKTKELVEEIANDIVSLIKMKGNK